jgi:hypothetical protein
MKKDDLKSVLKPLIKETIKEVLFEEGVLSKVVSEVAKGLGGQRIVEERKTSDTAAIQQHQEELEKQRQERIKRLNESSKLGDVFKGVKNIPEDNQHGALSGVASGDSGVDISGIIALSKDKWKHML